MKLFIRYFCFSLALFSIIITATVSEAAPTEKEVLAAMKKATGFMVDTVSNHGGYLWNYSEDFSEAWGETPARLSQIWVQGGTPDMGEMFLDMYEAAGSNYYLTCAEKAANALIWGQHPLGGWHYVIDFDMTGIEQWYKDVGERFKWGMEEYWHYYGNCTFDESATSFLLRLYMTTLDPTYRIPLLKALDFILMAQYPNGAWPQRYPLRYEFVHDGLADYTSYYTYNDNIMNSNIDLLIEAYEKLGNEKYLKAALKGVEFIIISQGPEEQAGWAEQYTHDMKSAQARLTEPSGYRSRYTIPNIRQLEKTFLMTGDKRYLNPIPNAIKWMEKSAIETLGDGKLRLARRYEEGTNLPIVPHETDEVNEGGYGVFRYDHTPDNDARWPRSRADAVVDINGLKREYERIRALTPEQARTEYKALKTIKDKTQKVNASEIKKLMTSMDTRGAWIENIEVHDVNLIMTASRYDTRKKIRGISTRSYMKKMYSLLSYLKTIK